MAYLMVLGEADGSRNLSRSPSIQSQALVPYKVSLTPLLIGNNSIRSQWTSL